MATKQTKSFSVGDKVRLTAKFLRSTGQYTGDEARRVWTITGHSGSFVVVDQALPAHLLSSFYTADELAADPSLAFRRFAPANLQICK